MNSSKLATSEVGQLFGQVSTCRVSRHLSQVLTPLWDLPRQDVISPNESTTITKESKNGCYSPWCERGFISGVVFILFSFVFFKFPCSTDTSMSFNPVLSAELLREHEWNVQSKNVIRERAQTSGSFRGSCKGDEDERNT